MYVKGATNTRGPIPRFVGGVPQPNYTDPGLCKKMGLPLGCHPSWKMPVCSDPPKATNCNPATRTVNTAAECGSEDDFYYYSPWRVSVLHSATALTRASRRRVVFFPLKGLSIRTGEEHPPSVNADPLKSVDDVTPRHIA